jgi:hypothetical protein
MRGVEWIQLAYVSDPWLAVVNTVMNLRVLEPQNCYTICLSHQLDVIATVRNSLYCFAA